MGSLRLCHHTLPKCHLNISPSLSCVSVKLESLSEAVFLGAEQTIRIKIATTEDICDLEGIVSATPAHLQFLQGEQETSSFSLDRATMSENTDCEYNVPTLLPFGAKSAAQPHRLSVSLRYKKAMSGETFTVSETLLLT